MQVEPNASYLDWISDAAGAAQSVVEGLDWGTGGWVVGLLAVVGLAAKLGPLLGPVGAAVSSTIQSIASIALPKQAQEAQHRLEVAESTLWEIVSVIEAVSPDDPIVKRLKEQITKNAPGEFQDLFRAWKVQRGLEAQQP